MDAFDAARTRVLTEMFHLRHADRAIAMSLEKLFAPGSAPAALGTRTRTRSRLALNEQACALCETLLDLRIEHRAFELVNPWLRCHACERFVHARCAKKAGLLSRLSSRSVPFRCSACLESGVKTLVFS